MSDLAAGKSARLQSPPRFSRLAANDDDLERNQARAAARRRKSIAVSQATVAASQPPAEEIDVSDLMDKGMIMDLYHNCIRLASENKINQKNTWDLGLIDHLSEIIKVEEEKDHETNFQKASCTLEAGVKIYSARVDSTHSEAYKVLGGMNRAGRDENIEGSETNIDTIEENGPSKKEKERKVSPTSTLESSFEALNVKKFDAAFTVDPLYHQTSAQFDEGGAKGLLLYNLGVYANCRVLFDSFEVPENCILGDGNYEDNMNETIDLTFAKESIENHMLQIPKTKDISPTLNQIISQFDEDNQRPSSDTISSLTQETLINDVNNNDHDNINNNGNNNDDGELGFGGNDVGPTWDNDNYNDNDNGFNYDDDYDRDTVINEDSGTNNMNSETYQEEQVGDEKLEKIADFLSLGLGFSSKTNAWAGPEHWKFRKTKGPEPVSESSENPEVIQKKTKTKKTLPDIDFSKPMDKNTLKLLFTPVKNQKSLLLPANRKPCNNIRLPEDCHYRPDSLVKFFQLPDVMCLGRKGRKQSYEEGEYNEDGFVPSWDNNDDMMSDNGQNDFGNDDFAPDNEPGSLLQKPRQVNKIDIQYDKVSKQVDVHAVKDMLWNQIQDSVKENETRDETGEKATASFSEILQQCRNESSNEISPHLYFICLLHLANEHNLALHGAPTLDKIDIEIPLSSLNK